MNILEKVKDETEPDAVAIAFDMKAPTFRHKAYAGYKAQRKGMPPELAAQMPVLKELLGDLGYKIVTCEGWEADDILGTFAETCENTDNTCMIATGRPGQPAACLAENDGAPCNDEIRSVCRDAVR